ncbi:hypothetical protein BC828DRAFT_384989 [Blastocladiella britannica]|nr:hypothetical protein BC828DRAFT_384989 [Blastocladiella britannica]
MLAHHLLPWSRATEFWRTDLVATVCPLAGPTAHALLVLHATLGMAARAAAAPADDWTAAETLLAYFDSVAPAAATATTQGMVGAAEPLTRAVACLGVLLELRAGNTAAARSRLDHLLVLHAAIEQRDATPNAGPVAVSGERCVVSVPNAPSALSTAPTAESAQPQTPSSVPIVLWTGLGNHEWRAVVYLLAGLVGADAVTQSRAVEMIRGGLVVLASNPTAVRTPTLHMHLHLAAIQLSLSQSHVAQAAELLRGIAYLPVSPSPATLHLLLAQTFHAARSYGHALAHYDAVASHPTGNTPDAPSPAARMLARTSMAMILMTTPSEPSVETEAAAMAILAQATKAATRKATRDPGAAAVATALANVLAEKEIVARKRKMLEAMTLAAAHYHVQTLTTVLAGCIYASTHEIASAAQAWQTGSRLASANAAQGLGGLSAACLQAREAILRLDPTAGNPSHPDELELVHRQATESAQDRETGRAALGAMRLVRAANHP